MRCWVSGSKCGYQIVIIVVDFHHEKESEMKKAESQWPYLLKQNKQGDLSSSIKRKTDDPQLLPCPWGVTVIVQVLSKLVSIPFGHASWAKNAYSSIICSPGVRGSQCQSLERSWLHPRWEGQNILPQSSSSQILLDREHYWMSPSHDNFLLS